jgi:hypothetical protein
MRDRSKKFRMEINITKLQNKQPKTTGSETDEDDSNITTYHHFSGEE